MDIGTGAGFTAFAMAEVSNHVMASDIIHPMLEQARRISSERGLLNVGAVQNAAESLPFANGSLDLITSRKVAHHYPDTASAIESNTRPLPSSPLCPHLRPLPWASRVP